MSKIRQADFGRTRYKRVYVYNILHTGTPDGRKSRRGGRFKNNAYAAEVGPRPIRAWPPAAAI